MAETALKGLGLSDREVSILITGDAEMRGLNLRFRNIDRPTDVLSFPMEDERLLGDVAVSIESAIRQARDFKVSLEEELARLLVHGVLHLIGYDHTKGGAQAKRMRAKENELMKKLREEGSIRS